MNIPTHSSVYLFCMNLWSFEAYPLIHIFKILFMILFP